MCSSTLGVGHVPGGCWVGVRRAGLAVHSALLRRRSGKWDVGAACLVVDSMRDQRPVQELQQGEQGGHGAQCAHRARPPTTQVLLDCLCPCPTGLPLPPSTPLQPPPLEAGPPVPRNHNQNHSTQQQGHPPLLYSTFDRHHFDYFPGVDSINDTARRCSLSHWRTTQAAHPPSNPCAAALYLAVLLQVRLQACCAQQPPASCAWPKANPPWLALLLLLPGLVRCHAFMHPLTHKATE